MNDIIIRNRNFGLEAVLQLAEERAPEGFADIADVLTQEELELTAVNFKKACGPRPRDRQQSRLDRRAARAGLALRGRDASYLAPPAQIRTCGFPAYGLYGAFFVKGASRHFCPRCYSILLFDPRREHSSIPTAHCRRRRAQRRSRTALL